MRLSRVRFTVRRMMVAVVIAGVVAWLSLTAYRVAYDPRAEQMRHLRIRRDTGEPVVHAHPIQGVFWPRYWRRLLGRPWPGSFVCPSCREQYERTEGRELIDIASSDDGSRLLAEMARMNQERMDRTNQEILNRLDPKLREAGAKFLREEAARRKSDASKLPPESDPPGTN